MCRRLQRLPSYLSATEGCAKRYGFCLLEQKTHLLIPYTIDERLARPLIKQLMHSAKRSVMKKFRTKKHRLLETELYAHWLDELDYVISGLEVCILTFD